MKLRLLALLFALSFTPAHAGDPYGIPNFDMQGKITWSVKADHVLVCWPSRKACYEFREPNFNNSAGLCADIFNKHKINAVEGFPVFRSRFSKVKPSEDVYGGFLDCAKNTPGKYWHGGLCYVVKDSATNEAKETLCAYVTENRAARITCDASTPALFQSDLCKVMQ